jgi:isopentenyl-diphosphate delta-isomerase
MKTIVVNEKDEIIGYKERNTITKGDIYRVSSLWIINSKNEVLLARRAFTKKHHPGAWGPAVAGTCEKGETYYNNIIKEAEEELGLVDIKPKKIRKVRYREDWNYFGIAYIINLDKDINKFQINRDEVAEVKWVSKEELLKNLDKEPFECTGSKKFWLETIKHLEKYNF